MYTAGNTVKNNEPHLKWCDSKAMVLVIYCQMNFQADLSHRYNANMAIFVLFSPPGVVLSLPNATVVELKIYSLLPIYRNGVTTYMGRNFFALYLKMSRGHNNVIKSN